MATRTDRGEKGRRRWIKAAWAASVLLLLLPFLGLSLMVATDGEDVLIASNHMARDHHGRAASNDPRADERDKAD